MKEYSALQLAELHLQRASLTKDAETRGEWFKPCDVQGLAGTVYGYLHTTTTMRVDRKDVRIPVPTRFEVLSDGRVECHPMVEGHAIISGVMREKGLTYRTKGGVSKTEYAVEVTPGQASGPLAKRGRIIVTLIKEGRS